jgi:hypothetical protein
MHALSVSSVCLPSHIYTGIRLNSSLSFSLFKPHNYITSRRTFNTFAKMKPTAAQIKRIMGDDLQTIVVIHPPAPEEVSYAVVGQKMLRLSGDEWQPLPYASQLGVEILYAAPTTNDFPLFIAADTNATLETLTLDCDPSSLSFGTPGRTSSRGMAFKFSDDSKIMSRAILEPLVLFINECFTAIKAALAGPGGMAQAIEEHEKLTPQEFRALFKKYRADQESAYPGKGWKGIECPVAPSMTNCEACGKVEDAVEGGNVMQQCGRCKKVRYCGKGCQAEDWKAHKPFCPR